MSASQREVYELTSYSLPLSSCRITTQRKGSLVRLSGSQGEIAFNSNGR